MPDDALIARYRSLLAGLLPRGIAWARQAGTVMSALLEGLAVEFARVEERSGNLVNEADPRTALELLAEWETLCGLPDVCTGEAETLAQRRAAVVGRLVALGGQSREYFEAVAAEIGYQVSITEFRPFRAGAAVAGDDLTNGEWAFAWQVNAPETSAWPFLAGSGAAGEPLSAWGNERLECVLARLKPAHTTVLFAYGG